MRIHRDEVHESTFPLGKINRRDIWRGICGWEVQLRYDLGVSLRLTAINWHQAVLFADLASRDRFQEARDQSIAFQVYS